jgi:hypothetical protein
MAQDDFSPRYVGDLANPLKVTFIDGLGTIYDLTSLVPGDFSMKLVPVEGNGPTLTCAGTWTINSPATAGVAQYPWQTNDVATAGLFYIRVKANVNADGKPLTFIPKVLEFLL